MHKVNHLTPGCSLQRIPLLALQKEEKNKDLQRHKGALPVLCCPAMRLEAVGELNSTIHNHCYARGCIVLMQRCTKLALDIYFAF